MAENKSWETLKEKGNALFKQNKYNEAIEYYERAIKINNTIEVLYSNKGTCEKCLKNYKQAIKDYKKALEINPKNTKNLNRLASVYIIVGNLGEAKIIQQKALNLEPNNSVYKDQMNIIAKIIEDEEKMQEKIKEQKFDDAEEICKRLIEKVPEFSDLKKHYIKILLENVKIQDTLAYIAQKVTAEDKMKDEEFNYLIALTLYFDGQYDKAKKLLNIIKQTNNSDKITDLIKKVNEIE